MAAYDLFLSLLERTDHEQCWEWGGYRDHGYGRVRVPWGRKRQERTHRLAYQLKVGPIPEGLCTLHRCDNPPCCNPAHLFLGTRAENAADKAAKGRARGNRMRGEGRFNTRIPYAIVQEIRRCRSMGISERVLARDFGISSSHVHRIVAYEERVFA